MKATYEYISQKFQEYNSLMFAGELPTPVFLPSKARSYLGRYECSVRRSLLGKTERYNHRLRINTVCDFPEEEIDDILIHEMIHYYIAYKGLKDASAHGPLFRSMMAEINTRFGRHITVSAKSTPQMAQQDTRVRRHYICVMTLPDGRTAFTPVTEQSMFTLWTRLPEAFSATDARWFATLDPFFNSYRKVSAARGRMPRLRTYPIAKAELEPHLASAVRLAKEGRTISRAKA